MAIRTIAQRIGKLADDLTRIQVMWAPGSEDTTRNELGLVAWDAREISKAIAEAQRKKVKEKTDEEKSSREKTQL